MKKLIFNLFAVVVTAAMPMAINADVILGIDSFGSGGSPDFTTAQGSEPAFTEVDLSFEFRPEAPFGVNNNGSTDGSFGSATDVAAATGDTTFRSALTLNNGDNGSFEFDITAAATAEDRVLTQFHFDAGGSRPNAATDFEVFLVGSDGDISLGLGTVTTNNAEGLPGAGDVDQAAFTDVDLDLSSFNIAFNAGDTLTFRADFTGGIASGGHNLRVDNIGISAVSATAAVPEPSSLAMLSLAGLGLMIRRRK